MSKQPPQFISDWKGDSSKRTALDETQAGQYIGKVVLIGVTYENSKGEATSSHQWVGKIKTYSNQNGIQVDLLDSDAICALPPDPRSIRPASPGTYRLKSTGQVIEDPDYLITWICTEPHAEKESFQL